MTNLPAALTFVLLTNWVDVPMTGGPAMQVAVVTRDTYASTVFEGVTNKTLIQSKVMGQPGAGVRQKPADRVSMVWPWTNVQSYDLRFEPPMWRITTNGHDGGLRTAPLTPNPNVLLDGDHIDTPLFRPIVTNRVTPAIVNPSAVHAVPPLR